MRGSNRVLRAPTSSGKSLVGELLALRALNVNQEHVAPSQLREHLSAMSAKVLMLLHGRVMLLVDVEQVHREQLAHEQLNT